MSDSTLTRYLKLKIAADLSADARYNLQRIDALGATFITDSTEDLQVRSRGNVTIEAESLDVGGSGSGGTIRLGTSSSLATIQAYTTSFNLRSPLSLFVDTAGANKLLLAVNATQSGSATVSLKASADAALTVPPGAGEVTTDVATQTLTNKTISGSSNTLTNISYSSLLLTGTIVNGDIAAGAAIVDTKLATISTAGKVSNSATTAASSNTASALVARDGSGNFSAGTITATLSGNASNITAVSNSTLTTLSSLSLPGSQVSGNIGGNAANVTGIVAISNGGTGNNGSNKATALLDLLPLATGNAQKVLRLNTAGDGVEWYATSGTGTVTSVDLSMPGEFVVTNNPITTLGTLTVNKASQAANLIYASPNGSSGIPTFRSLVEADIPTLAQSKVSNLVSDLSTLTSAVAGKEPAVTGGTTAQYYRGDKSFQTLDTAAVPENGSLYFTDARARTAAVVNSTAGSETDQAPSVSSIKAYIAAIGGGAVSSTWSTANGVTKSITHSLNTATVSVTVYDENGEDILVDTIDRTSNNAVTLTSSVAPTGNWTVVIRP